jgi:XTP/dITP diphosphohydrolase
VPFGQPALALAAQLQRRAARAGAPDELARLEPREPREPGESGESGEPGAPGRPGAPGAPGADIGRELFLLVAKAREMDLDPETELRAAARRYQDRVRAWERS